MRKCALAQFQDPMEELLDEENDDIYNSDFVDGFFGTLAKDDSKESPEESKEPPVELILHDQINPIGIITSRVFYIFRYTLQYFNPVLPVLPTNCLSEAPKAQASQATPYGYAA